MIIFAYIKRSSLTVFCYLAKMQFTKAMETMEFAGESI